MKEQNKVKQSNEITSIVDQNAAILSSPDFVSPDARITSRPGTNDGVQLYDDKRLVSY